MTDSRTLNLQLGVRIIREAVIRGQSTHLSRVGLHQGSQNRIVYAIVCFGGLLFFWLL